MKFRKSKYEQDLINALGLEAELLVDAIATNNKSEELKIRRRIQAKQNQLYLEQQQPLRFLGDKPFTFIYSEIQKKSSKGV